MLKDEQIRVLVVDDEKSILDFLHLGLSYEGFQVQVAANGEEGLRLAGAFHPHVVILDLMMPGINGMDLCRSLRPDKKLIIIMLTAKDEVPDRVAGLELGADDYIVKPFSFKELVARIKTRLRRQSGLEQDQTLRYGELVMDLTGRRVTLAGRSINLSAREFDLLKTFLQHPGVVLSKQKLLDLVWGFDFFGDVNVVEVYIKYLREKLADHDHLLIQTVRGAGYRLGE